MQYQPTPEPAAQLRNAYTVTMAMLSDPHAAVVSCNPAMCNRNRQTVNVLSLRTLVNCAVMHGAVIGSVCCD